MSKLILKETTSAVRVTNFLDYKEFLASVFDRLKRHSSEYSYVQFAEDLGFSPSNVIWLVIAGRRKLTTLTSQRIIEALGLSGIERRYFTALVKHNNTRNAARRDTLTAQLLALKSSQLPSEEEQRQLEYFAQWYYPVIREMVGMAEFIADPAWIALRLYGRLLPREIREALDLLQRLALITTDLEKGRFVQTGGQVNPSRPVEQMASIRFHEKILDIAHESIARVPPNRRDFNAITLCISDQTAEKLKELTREFCEKALAIENEFAATADQVYQLNIQLFPFTKNSDSKKEKGS